MRKETMTYTDFDGNERTEDFYFNLTEAELMKLNISKAKDGGLEELVKRMMNENDGEGIIELFENVLTRAYGEKAPDGKHFVKTKEKTEAFMQTNAYSDLFVKLITDAEYAADFINKVIPNHAPNNSAV